MYKNIAVICVNYNSYSELQNYLYSLDNAIVSESLECTFDVYVVDNSSNKKTIDLHGLKNIIPKIIQLENNGYFGGAFYVINNLVEIQKYSYVIISNVDILFEQDFFINLSQLKLSDDIAWISPYRYSQKYNMPIFVEKLKRLPRWKMRLLLFLYKYPALKKMQHAFTMKRYERKSQLIPSSVQQIYAGCGSCIVLTSIFFKFYPQISYPVFLYGEEIFLAELIRLVNLKVLYVPSVKIVNIGSVSTGKIDFRRLCQYNYSALQYIYTNFYIK